MDLDMMKNICTRDLVFTNSIFGEIKIALPVCSKIAQATSYWMPQGKIFHELNLANVQDEHMK